MSPTRDGVVQEKAQKSTDEHARGQQHLDDLVQLENPWGGDKSERVPRDEGPCGCCPWSGPSPEDGESPVWSFSGFLFTQLGMASPQKMEKPKTNRFLDEFMSTYCGREAPTATRSLSTFAARQPHSPPGAPPLPLPPEVFGGGG